MADPFPSEEVPTESSFAYIRSPSRSASESLLRTRTPRPSPRTVPSPSASKGRASPVAESAGVFEKHMYIKMSLNVSTPPVMTMSERPLFNSIDAKCTAANEEAHAASVTQFVPWRSNLLAMRPATTLPNKPGNEFSCQST